MWPRLAAYRSRLKTAIVVSERAARSSRARARQRELARSRRCPKFCRPFLSAAEPFAPHVDPKARRARKAESAPAQALDAGKSARAIADAAQMSGAPVHTLCKPSRAAQPPRDGDVAPAAAHARTPRGATEGARTRKRQPKAVGPMWRFCRALAALRKNSWRRNRSRERGCPHRANFERSVRNACGLARSDSFVARRARVPGRVSTP